MRRVPHVSARGGFAPAVSVLLLSGVAMSLDGVRADEPVVGKPCEGCELVFEGLPASLDAEARIVPEGAPGETLVVSGTVVGPDGAPRAGVVVYAYQTDAEGIYPNRSSSNFHGDLRAWVRTDERGRYRFVTVRPGSYPGTRVPAHVHMHVLEPGCCTYYIDDVHFTDDPLLSPRERERLPGRGGGGVVEPIRDAEGVWHVERDIRLGEEIPGYPR